MQIGTFNVNSIRSRKDLVLSWLEKKPLDILCLQELKGENQTFPYSDFEAAGYQCAVFGEKRYNGVAICSQEGLEGVVQGFQGGFLDGQSRLIRGQVGPIQIINVYVPHGGERGSEKYHYKLNWYSHFLQELQQTASPEELLFIVGDFNVTQGDLDVYDPEMLQDKVGTMPEERKALQDLLDWGLVDTFRHLYPHQKEFSWWDYRNGAFWKNKGMRIDYILCTEPLLPYIQEVQIDIWPRRRRKPTPSDHTPVVATFHLELEDETLQG